MKIKAAIFDLDGTLFYSLPDIANSINKVLEAHNYPTHPHSEIEKMIGNGFRKLVERALPNKESQDYKLVDKLDIIARDIYKENLCIDSKIYDGIDKLLDFLTEKGISININTNKPHNLVQPIVDHYFNKWDIKYAFGQRENLPIKPDPSTALEITANLGLKPEDVIFIGDSYVDINTAKNAGMTSVAVTWGYATVESLKEAKPDNLVESPTDIFNIL